MISTRRGFLGGLLSALAAPAIVRAELLMPVKVVFMPWGEIDIDDEIRPDPLRQDDWLCRQIDRFAAEYGLTMAHEPEFQTLGRSSDYFYSPFRRATVRFVTDNPDFIKAHKEHPHHTKVVDWCETNGDRGRQTSSKTVRFATNEAEFGYWRRIVPKLQDG